MSGWGRDGTRTSGSSGGRAVVVFLSLAALAVAGTDIASRLGYFNLPFLSSTSAQTEQLQEQVASLEQRLSDALAKVGAAPQVDGLYREIEQQAEEIAKLRDEREKLLSGEAESAISLRSELDQLRNVQIPTLEKELGNRDRSLKELEGRLKLAEEVTKELQGSAGQAVAAQEQQLKTQIAQRDAMLKQLDAELARLAPLETEVAALKKDVAEAAQIAIAEQKARSELTSANAQIAKANSDLAKASSDLAKARQEFADVSSERDRLAADLTLALSQLAALKPAAAETPPANTGVTAPARQVAPRDPQQVANAMQRAQGLGAISNVQRDRIATGLIEGECVGKVLSDILGRAPAVTTRDLIRALDSDC